MKKRISILLVLAFVIAALSACGSSVADPTEPAATTTPAVSADATETPVPAETTVTLGKAEDMPETYTLGDTFCDFTVTLCDGTEVTLSELLKTHKCVMINIWATWCNPCINEFPYMNEAYDLYKEDVAVVCLSPYDENEDVAAFREEYELTLPMGYDSVGLGGALVYEGYPTTIIIDRFGKYVYYECGSMQSVGAFSRMFDTFISDEYTTSTIYTAIPGPKPTVANAKDADLTAALCKDGTVAFSNSIDAYAWPFVITEDGVVNSNSDVDTTTAYLLADITANAGDVFSIDYKVDSDLMYDYLAVVVDDEETYYLTGLCSGTFLYEVKEAGAHVISIEFVQDDYASETDCTNVAVLSNAALLTGDAAAAALANAETYPSTLDDPTLYTLEMVTESAKEIVFDDPMGVLISNFGEDTKYYIVNSETAEFKVEIGSDIDVNQAVAYADSDYEFHQLRACDTVDGAYYFTVEVASVEAGGYDNTYVYFFPTFIENTDGIMSVIFLNEENANYFITNDLVDSTTGEPYGITWQYADGTAPSTDAVAEEPEDTGYTYTIKLVDETGAPVEGVMINICTDETCTPTTTTGGEYSFVTSAPFAYVIHVLTVPEGYTFDTTQAFTMDENGGELTITIPHAN